VRFVLSQTPPKMAGFLLLFEMLFAIQGSRRSGYTVGLQNRIREFESLLPCQVC
jgi:hypothetical protein